MNIERARELKAKGLKWKEIGERLAVEERRPIPYLGRSVERAVRLAKRGVLHDQR
jgi:orotate phosphoribosyltransferase-like protein